MLFLSCLSVDARRASSTMIDMYILSGLAAFVANEFFPGGLHWILKAALLLNHHRHLSPWRALVGHQNVTGGIPWNEK